MGGGAGTTGQQSQPNQRGIVTYIATSQGCSLKQKESQMFDDHLNWPFCGDKHIMLSLLNHDNNNIMGHCHKVRHQEHQ